MNIVLWVVQVLLALSIFVGAGAGYHFHKKIDKSEI